MSSTLIHSRSEWKSFPPAKTFGVGRPSSVSREPSVPPRIDVELRLEPDAPRRLERRVDDVAGRGRAPRACCGTAPSGSKVTRARGSPQRPPRRAASTSASCSSSFAASWSRRISVTVAALGAALDLVRVHEALASLGRLRRERVARAGSSTNRAASLTGLTSWPLASRGGRRRRGRSTFSSIRGERLVLDLADRRPSRV